MSLAEGIPMDTSRNRGSSLPPEGTMLGRTPPATPKKASGKFLAVKTLMLDDMYTLFQIQAKAVGAVLLEQICRQLNLLESDYFGVEYTDGNTCYWLDLDKPMNRQVCLSQVEPVVRFCVKFYTPDPAQLEEEYTRYLFALQIKRDLAHGELLCNENTAALLASFIVQAECGDYAQEDYPDHRYLSLFKFIPTQDTDLERKIMDNHKKHVGMSPGAADLNLLETARRCELFGNKMHPAKDHENVALNLAVANMGVLVFQGCTKINTFSWAKIRKISFKRKKFLIKLHPEGYSSEDVVEFFFDGRNECKNFWKKCVEHHGFFRCLAVQKLPRQKTRVMSRGSSFRYSGRTQKQVQEYIRNNYGNRQPFQRSQSFRHSPSLHTNVNMSASATPLSTIGNNQCAGTPVSLSCGSMTLTSTADVRSPGSPTRHEGHDYDPRALETPSGQGTLSPDASLPSSPHRSNDYHLHSERPLQSPSSLNLQLGSPTPFTQSQHRVTPGPLQSPDSMNNGSVGPAKISMGSSFEDSPINSHIISNDKMVNGDDKATKISNDVDVDLRKRKGSTDPAYFIIKEMLTTERTYKKDLEVINVWFRDEVKKEEAMPQDLLRLIFGVISPIYEFHSKLVKDLDNRLAQWDARTTSPNRDSQKIGDLFLKNLHMFPLYESYLEEHSTILSLWHNESSGGKNRRFEQLYRDFETQKVCYLPLTSFLLKPLHRLQHYLLLFSRLTTHFSNTSHPDLGDCTSVEVMLAKAVNKLGSSVGKAENYVKLIELQRDLVGIDNLVQPGREFLREGCLQKLSRKGYQQRMFFLFNDVLLYTNRTTTPNLQFKVHGQLPLRGVMVEENDSRMGAANCFTIYGGNRALMVSANNEEDKNRWLDELGSAISIAKSNEDEAFHYLSLKSISISDEVLDRNESAEDPSVKADKGPHTRSNTTVHVCWHRATSVASKDYIQAVENQLSGYLLRKFKNSTGWQKLWVVFTNFCLFFYKTFQDDFPLASLPLLGYTISTPGPDDQIQKEFVFKLQFKNHVYFFRAESEFTFSRWMDVISSATKGSVKTNKV